MSDGVDGVVDARGTSERHHHPVVDYTHKSVGAALLPLLGDDWLIVFDIDGTVVSPLDTLGAILDSTSPLAREFRTGVDARVERGELTRLEGVEECFHHRVHGPRISVDDAVALVERAASPAPVIDPSFSSLVRLCVARGFRVVVLSTGFSSLISRLLPQTLLDQITLIAHDVAVSDEDRRWALVRNPAAVSKADAVQLLLPSEGATRVMFVGDDVSDVSSVAAVADLLFAGTNLALAAKPLGVPHVAFHTMEDVYRRCCPQLRVRELCGATNPPQTISAVLDSMEFSRGSGVGEALRAFSNILPACVYVGIGSHLRADAPALDQQLPEFALHGWRGNAPTGGPPVGVLLVDPKFCGDEAVPAVVREGGRDGNLHWRQRARNVWTLQHPTNEQRVELLLFACAETVGETAACPNLAHLATLVRERSQHGLPSCVAQFAVPYMAVPEIEHLVSSLGQGQFYQTFSYLHLAAYARDRHGTRVWRPPGQFSQNEALLKELARYSTEKDTFPSFGAGTYALIPGDPSFARTSDFDAMRVQTEGWAAIQRKGGSVYVEAVDEMFLNDAVAWTPR